MKKNILYFIILLYTVNLHSEQPTTLFCHGIVDNSTQMNRYENLIAQPKLAFDFPDAQTPEDWSFNSFIYHTCALFGKKYINREKMYLGYGPDVKTLHNQIDSKQNYILFGLSRGGLTVLNYLAEYNPENISAVIIESAPVDLIEVANFLQYSLGYKFAPTREDQEKLLKFVFPAYQLNSKPCIETIPNIQNKNLPIFIIHSQDDSRVHISSSWQMYLAFIKAGFTNVYLCELTTGIHAHYMECSEKHIYFQALHSFYKKYNFTHNLEFATFDLAKLQPSQEEISEKLTTFQNELEKKYRTKNLSIQQMITSTAATILCCISSYLKKL